jgi:hypothetical protein
MSKRIRLTVKIMFAIIDLETTGGQTITRNELSRLELYCMMAKIKLANTLL